MTADIEAQPGATSPLLTVTSLSSGYGDIVALWDVSLTVWPGQVTAVLGRNGAGKTTTLLTIAGILKTRSGRVELDSRPLDTNAHTRTRLGVSLVQENKRIFHLRTVEENLLLGGYTRSRDQRRASLARTYERFPILEPIKRKRAAALSGGQQQILAIAQALMAEPKLLMIDEPSAGLAPILVADVFDTIRGLKAEGIGVLLVEQLVDQALGIADHVVVLDQGKVALSAPADELRDVDSVRDVYLGGGSSSTPRTSG